MKHCHLQCNFTFTLGKTHSGITILISWRGIQLFQAFSKIYLTQNKTILVWVVLKGNSPLLTVRQLSTNRLKPTRSQQVADSQPSSICHPNMLAILGSRLYSILARFSSYCHTVLSDSSPFHPKFCTSVVIILVGKQSNAYNN